MTLDGVLMNILAHLDQHRDDPGYPALLVRLREEIEERMEKEEVCESK